jgi:hypothetical protein
MDIYQHQPPDYTPTPPSQALQVWTHLRPPKPETSQYLFNALHLHQGHRRAPQHFGKWVKKKGGQNYFTFHGKYLINNWIVSIKAKQFKLPVIWSIFVCLFVCLFLFACHFARFSPSCPLQKLSPTILSISKACPPPL